MLLFSLVLDWAQTIWTLQWLTISFQDPNLYGKVAGALWFPCWVNCRTLYHCVSILWIWRSCCYQQSSTQANIITTPVAFPVDRSVLERRKLSPYTNRFKSHGAWRSDASCTWVHGSLNTYAWAMGQSDCTGTHGFCNTEDFISVLVFCHAFKSVVLHENSFFNLSLDVSVLPPSHLKVLLWYHDQWGWSQCFKLLITFWIRLWLIYSKKKKKKI